MTHRLFLCIILAGVAAAPSLAAQNQPSTPPLKYRIVSFHNGRADKDLIRRAAELGFNGVQFQLEGGNVGPLKDFAERDKREGYIDLCHSLGMKVTLWVHELSDIPGENDPGYLGPITVGNNKLWKSLEDRYEWLLGELLPNIDGIALTVVETQINATQTDLMLKLVDVIRGKCRKYDKLFIVRTFVHHPDQFEGVMACVKQLPDDLVIMTKCVPQDWQLRGTNDKAIGAVGNHEQIIEYDVMGEYFLTDSVALCFPDVLKAQFDYGLKHGVDGICVRVDRGSAEVLHAPQEMNLWTLGMLASGKASRVDDIWKAWAEKRYGKDAAAGVIRALKPTYQVMAEALNIGSFSFGDTRSFPPPNGDKDALLTNWANFRWDDSYIPEYKLGLAGDPRYTRKIERQKTDALRAADRCINELDAVKAKLDADDYDILRTKLLTNRVQLQLRAPMMLAWLRYRRILTTKSEDEKTELAARIRSDLRDARNVAEAQYAPPREIEYLGRKWLVGPPMRLDAKRTREWCEKMESLLVARGLKADEPNAQ